MNTSPAEGTSRPPSSGSGTRLAPLVLAIAGACASPPVADLVADPAQGPAPLQVRFDATGSHDPGYPEVTLEARFDFDGDGRFDTEFSTDLVAEHRYDQAGTFAAKVEIRGGDGRIGAGTFTVQVGPNTPPTAALAVSPQAGFAPLAVVLDASGSSDPDQEAVTLEVRFDFESDGTFDTEFSTTKQVAHHYHRVGEHRATVEVRDRGGLVSTQVSEPIRVRPGANIDADTNRDGVIDERDDEGEEVWSPERGAVFIANLDDDDRDRRQDGLDDAVTADEDLEDLAPLIVRHNPDLVSGRDRVTLTVEPAAARGHVRLFIERGGEIALLYRPGGGAEVEIDAALVAAGDVRLYLEGVRGRVPAWDGRVLLRLAMQIDGQSLSDEVMLRVSPVIFTDNLRPVETLYVMRITDFRMGPNREFYGALETLLPPGVELYAADQYRYVGDRWLQDNMQVGYQSMPAPGGGGAAHVMPTYLQTERPTEGYGLESFVPVELLGPNVGYAYPGRTRDTSLNYGGNLEVVPPHSAKGERYPLGRMIYGGGNQGLLRGRPYQDTMATLQRDWLNAQEIQGPAIEVSSEWLAVGHIDEVFLFVPDLRPGAARPWKVLIASPSQAREALELLAADGLGSAVVFRGRETQTTVSRILSSATLTAFNQAAQVRIDSIRERLKEELDLTEEDFVEVPVLYAPEVFEGFEFAAAYNPGIQNLVVVGDTLFVPDPEGPAAPGGTDVWRELADRALRDLGLIPHFVDVFDSYHLQLGEAHCGTGAYSTPWEEPWWNHDAPRRRN